MTSATTTTPTHNAGDFPEEMDSEPQPRSLVKKFSCGDLRRLSLRSLSFGSSRGSAKNDSIVAAAAAAAASYNEGVSGAHLKRSSFSSDISDPYAPSSRYDLKTLRKILAESDGESESGSVVSNEAAAAAAAVVDEGRIITSKEQTNHGLPIICRQVLVIIASIGIIVGASFGIREVIITNNKNLNPTSKQHSISAASFQVQQRLLEIAEEVVLACSEQRLYENMSHCQNLCHGKLCCVAKDEEYSCEDDESKNCAVYAGCEALIEGFA